MWGKIITESFRNHTPKKFGWHFQKFLNFYIFKLNAPSSLRRKTQLSYVKISSPVVSSFSFFIPSLSSRRRIFVLSALCKQYTCFTNWVKRVCVQTEMIRISRGERCKLCIGRHICRVEALKYNEICIS